MSPGSRVRAATACSDGSLSRSSSSSVSWIMRAVTGPGMIIRRLMTEAFPSSDFRHLTLRPMRREDVQAAVALCRASQWNQTEREWELFLAMAAERTTVAEHAGAVVGTAVTTVYAPAVAWIAMVLVDPRWRGRGIGRALLDRAVEHAPAGSTPTLDATPAGRPLYLALGFTDEYGLTRYRARLADPEPLVAGTASGHVVQRADPKDLETLVALDRRVFGADRRVLLEWYSREWPDRACVSRSGSDPREADITGFALARPGHAAEHVGPIIACSTAEAIALASTALSQARAGAVILDVPDRQEAFREWLLTKGFAMERPLTRMRRGPAVPGQPDHLFAIAGPELG